MIKDKYLVFTILVALTLTLTLVTLKTLSRSNAMRTTEDVNFNKISESFVLIKQYHDSNSGNDHSGQTKPQTKCEETGSSGELNSLSISGMVADSFRPVFSPSTRLYYVTVDYVSTSVVFQGHPSRCHQAVKLFTGDGLELPTSWSLGVGMNKITISVVSGDTNRDSREEADNTSNDNRDSTSEVMGSYTLYVKRLHRDDAGSTDGRRNVGRDSGETISYDRNSNGDKTDSNEQGIPLGRSGGGDGGRIRRAGKICQLYQECSMRYDHVLPCGLLKSQWRSWKQFELEQQQLPMCKDNGGGESGSWLVACDKCSQGGTCEWKSAKWFTGNQRCRIKDHVPQNEFRKCSKYKKVLYVGDSTNRGIMNYMIEKVNFTLREWHKTHHLRVFNKSINSNTMTVAFSYYPQFWVPDEDRISFIDTVEELIESVVELEDNYNTVLVVGGVQWINENHLKELKLFLERKELLDIKVIVKSLSAGFHQKIKGQKYSDENEHLQLLKTNQELKSLAKQLNFRFVDTFNMTTSRYRDYTEGSCSCHYHTIKESLPNFSEYNSKDTTNGLDIGFHVSGEVNQLYSEQLLSHICN